MSIKDLESKLTREDIRKLESFVRAVDFGDQLLFHGTMFNLKSGAIAYSHYLIKKILEKEHIANYGDEKLPDDIMVVCKPSFDRGRREHDQDHIVSATGAKVKSHLVDNGDQLDELVTERTKVIVCDELQFTDPSLYNKMQQYRERGENPALIILAGLTYTYDNTIPFPIMLPTSEEANLPNIYDTLKHSTLNMLDVMFDSTISVKLGKAICSTEGCGKPGIHNQRIVNGKPAPKGHPLFILGTDEKSKHNGEEISYRLGCKDCYVPPQ